VIRAINRLDIIFYQSAELLEKAAGLLGMSKEQMSRDRHVVLPHGIPTPPLLAKSETRNRVRRELEIKEEQILVLSIGRVYREKGIFELINAVSLAASQDPRIYCVIVGSDPAFDETLAVRQKLAELPGIGQRMRLLPACSPDQVWEYLCAADIFAFTSYQEGMPNSLLEAMAMGVPAVAFAIPSVVELEAGTGAVLLVPPFNPMLFAEALARLAASAADRARIGKKGRAQVMARFMNRKNMASAIERLADAVCKRSPSQASYLPLSRASVPQVSLLRETDE
jgi:glycosyltransferase involved in cell wall biosynthesis